MSRRKKDDGLPDNGGEFAADQRDEAEVNLAVPDDEHIARTLSDFLEFADTAARLVERGREAFDDDEMLQLAAESIMHKIGESVARLPDEFTQSHPAVSWRPMTGMRNKVAHEYRAIDYDIVWGALEQRLPNDAAEVRKILDEME